MIWKTIKLAQGVHIRYPQSYKAITIPPGALAWNQCWDHWMWEVGLGPFTPPTCAMQKAPTVDEVQFEKAWELCKEHAYMEIGLQLEDQACILIRTNHDPVVAWSTLRSMHGNRLANSWAALSVEILHIQYDGAGILKHKSKMDTLHMKLTKAWNPILDSMYLNFFINSLPEEFDTLVSTVNYGLDTVEEVVGNICQVEMKQGLHTTYEGSAFAVTKGKTQKGKQSHTAIPSTWC